MSSDLTLKLGFETAPNNDRRNCSVNIVRNGREVELYYFATPLELGWQNTIMDLTTRCSRRDESGEWTDFAQVTWYPNQSISEGRVDMGTRTFTFQQMARKKTPASASRRFTAGDGSEYKWKRPMSGSLWDLECVPVPLFGQRPAIAQYDHLEQILRVTRAGQSILDDIIITLFVHNWRRSKGYDMVPAQT